MRLESINVTDLDTAWPAVEPWIRAACGRPGSDLTASDLRALVEREEAALILILADGGRPVAAGVTQVRDYESGRRSCWILALGGSGARAWRETLRQIEAGARRVGCAEVEFVGRRGWGFLLPEYAATACETGTHFSKSLRD